MLAFVHIHKTAGTTLDYILERSYGIRHCGVPGLPGKGPLSAEDYRRIQALCPSLVSIAGHSISACSDLERARPDIRYYTFLREPLVRCASHYQYQVQQQGKGYSFEQWIGKDLKRNPQTKRIAGENGTVKDAINILKSRFFFVGLVEHFDESLVMFQRLVGDPRLDIWYRRKRAAPNDAIKRQLLDDPKIRPLLEDANRQDLELYEFVVRDLYPRLRCAYGESLDTHVASFKRLNEESSSRLRPRLNHLANRYITKKLVLVKRTISYYR